MAMAALSMYKKPLACTRYMVRMGNFVTCVLSQSKKKEELGASINE